MLFTVKVLRKLKRGRLINILDIKNIHVINYVFNRWDLFF